MADFTPPYTDGRRLRTLVKVIVSLWESGVLSKYDDLYNELSKALEDAIGKDKKNPLFKVDHFVPHEPPSSTKYNRIFVSAYQDLGVLAQELDVMRAWANLCYNQTTDALETLTNMVNGTKEQYKTALVLCSSPSPNSSAIYFLGKQPWESYGGGSTQLTVNGTLQLAATSNKIVETPISYSVLDGNGFAGDFHRAYLSEVLDTNGKPLLDEKTVTFFYQLTGTHDDLTALTDNNPLSWFDYEAVDITTQAHTDINDYNIYYESDVGRVKWCQSPEEGYLFIDLYGEFDSPTMINKISLRPLIKDVSKTNDQLTQHQIPKLDSICVTEDGTEWTFLSPNNFYLSDTLDMDKQIGWGGTSSTPQYEEVAGSISPEWSFPTKSVRAMRVRLLAEKPQLNVGIGHFFYLDTSPAYNKDGDKKDNFLRIDGDNPRIDDPTYFNQSMDDAVTKTSRRLEVLDGWRWCISIRDITYSVNYYVPNGEAESITTNFDKEIDRLSISVTETIPANCSLEYYITADAGKTWTKILPTNRDRDTDSITPTVIVFNEQYPTDLMPDSSVSYVNTIGKADRLKLKVTMSLSGTEGDLSQTPELIDYTISIIFKE